MRTIQQEIIQRLHVQADINPALEVRRSVNFLKDYLKKYPFIKALVLGISGGQDSSLAGRLAQLAIEELRQETGDEQYQFYAIRLPYGQQADESDAQKALQFIQADHELTINIQAAVEATVAELTSQGIPVSDFNKGNIKARERMIAQYAVAGAVQGAVVGTDHAAENVTGFFTKFGDGGADILPLARLNKRQGKALLQELGAPAELYQKIPTADLEENQPLLADEAALGVSYQAIDDYLEGKTIAPNEAEIIEAWYAKTEHKRRLPITVFDDFWR